jgi:hypothetical protein
MREEVGLHHRPERREIHRLVGQADEDVSARSLAGDGLHTELRGVEPLAHLAREEQRAVEIVSPLMVGTDELGRRSLVLQADSAAAMTA